MFSPAGFPWKHLQEFWCQSLASKGLVLECSVDNSIPSRSPSEEGTLGVQVSNLCCPLLFPRLLFLSVLVTKATVPAKLHSPLMRTGRPGPLNYTTPGWRMKGVAELALSWGSAFQNWTLMGGGTRGQCEGAKRVSSGDIPGACLSSNSFCH